MSYQILIDDNFHYMDESHRTKGREHETLEAAMADCRSITDASIEEQHDGPMTAKELYLRYITFGEDPWIAGAEGVPFSARDYAKTRVEELCKEEKHNASGN